MTHRSHDTSAELEIELEPLNTDNMEEESAPKTEVSFCELG